jgi:hypothetical protein
MRRIIIALLLAAIAQPALAYRVERTIYVSTEGIRHYWGTTTEGVVFIAPENMPGDMYLLTPDCVVENFHHGTGSWGFEEGGWQISFGLRHQIYFPGPMPPVDLTNCMMLR